MAHRKLFHRKSTVQSGDDNDERLTHTDDESKDIAYFEGRESGSDSGSDVAEEFERSVHVKEEDDKEAADEFTGIYPQLEPLIQGKSSQYQLKKETGLKDLIKPIIDNFQKKNKWISANFKGFLETFLKTADPDERDVERQKLKKYLHKAILTTPGKKEEKRAAAELYIALLVEELEYNVKKYYHDSKNIKLSYLWRITTDIQVAINTYPVTDRKFRQNINALTGKILALLPKSAMPVNVSGGGVFKIHEDVVHSGMSRKTLEALLRKQLLPVINSDPKIVRFISNFSDQTTLEDCEEMHKTVQETIKKTDPEEAIVKSALIKIERLLSKFIQSQHMQPQQRPSLPEL